MGTHSHAYQEAKKVTIIMFFPFSIPSSSGLPNWEPYLIKRTDLIRTRENLPPVKWTRSANIQTIFYTLLAGLLAAQTCLVLELNGYILKKLEVAVCLSGFAFLSVVQVVKRIFEKTSSKCIFLHNKMLRYK